MEIFNFFNNKHYQHPIAFGLFRLMMIISTFIGIFLFYIILSFYRIRKSNQAEPINILVVESQLDKLLKKLKND